LKRSYLNPFFLYRITTAYILQLLYQIPWGKIDPPEDGLQKLPSIPGFLEGVKDGNLGQNDWSSGGHGEFCKTKVCIYRTKNTVI
jgi:hypothetical protein